MISKPSGSEFVTIMTSESFEIISEASTNFPLIFPATVAFANPGPIELERSSIEIFLEKSFLVPSGKVITVSYTHLTLPTIRMV